MLFYDDRSYIMRNHATASILYRRLIAPRTALSRACTERWRSLKKNFGLLFFWYLKSHISTLIYVVNILLIGFSFVCVTSLFSLLILRATDCLALGVAHQLDVRYV